jgi:D-arabinose 1-dehydrogenase-like Zn-dependent alcohol dehydrogenase
MQNEAYYIEPQSVKFDRKFIDFSTPKTEDEYNSLKYLIEKNGQERPIVMRGNLCGDGFHRVKIAKELGRKVLAIDVDPDLSDSQMIQKCNLDTFGAKNPTPTQKAIHAYKLATTFGYSDAAAIKTVGLPKGTKVVGYVRTIANSTIGKELNVVDTLSRNESVTISGKTTKSIEIAKRLIQLQEEELMRNKAEQELEKNEVVIDYNKLLKSESANEVFWNAHKTGWDSIAHKLKFIELLNTVYKTEEAKDE